MLPSTKKELAPIKKRRVESLLHTEVPYSSPSSLSSLSPERSNRTSSEREPGFNDLSPLSSIPTEKHFGAQNGVTSRPDSPEKNLVSQHSLEMELFGVTSEDAPRVDEINKKKKKNGTVSKHKPAARMTFIDAVAVTAAAAADDDGEDTKAGTLLGSVLTNPKGQDSSIKRSNGHNSGTRIKHHSGKTLKGPRRVVVINTKKGTVTWATIPIPSSSVQLSQGNNQRPSKPLLPIKDSKSDIKKLSSTTTTNGVGPRKMSILHSDQIVASAMNRYKNRMFEMLDSPRLLDATTFALMKPFLSRSKTETDDKDEYNPIEDLTQTVRIITEHFFNSERSKELFGSSDEGLYRKLTKYKVRKDGAQFMKIVEDFNQIMQKQKAQGTIRAHVKQHGHRLPYDLVVHILQQVYSRTVAARASKLNQYEAFSNNVYGEILPILTKEFIEKTKLDHTKVFVDLGCGIGNVVLQVALQTGAESYGVEIMDTPAKFAKKQAKDAYGLKHGKVSMLHGDFLDTPGLPAILARADVVLVNNYAFNSALNQSLLQLFLDLKEGCKIISLKTFVPLDHKINVRNAGSVESILRVKKHMYYTNAVSWTHNGGEYFIATVDRTAMQTFWANGGASLDDGVSKRSSTRRR
ncbi:Nucleosomal histone H3-Lys79 methylase [Modicella reniformis]|uniref:Histone-lysine N-methyltransferase, H3 lysine-79 specific n=1 Tax=Modicella reniformis TaxID=1440133 RepID=A0A9P6M7V8_9FUNG|nr:Nucleosomal histone H3-Lys79 methylase [Modicella reniformis]